ncbi:MAG TPA: glucan biosynthesis protein D [Burkholderiaceae bacterium]|jgi:glucans biosynthesis protein
MKRRELLKATAAFGLTAWSFPSPAMSTALTTAGRLKHVGATTAFDYAWLKGQARSLAGKPYASTASSIPPEITALDWDQYQSIRYRDSHALWAGDNLAFQVKFFHLGLYFHDPVTIYEVADGQAQEIAYAPDLFDYGKSGLHGERMPPNLGFAGFRVNFRTDMSRDVTAFLGASYFRAVGGDWQYGMSARGLAIDCGLPTAEEFPRFSKFWLVRPLPGADNLVVYALLDSPSVTGAYRFEIRPGATQTMEVDAALYPRKTMAHMGIAPLTSMFRCGENDCRSRDDWRPSIHDSDGLSMWRGNGEWIWRPLTDPKQLQFNVYQDDAPRGFGLLQRDRNFDHYQDDGVFYERRPSVWVEPKAGWGKGSVQLVEIPTEDETSDNIAAFWHPDTPAQPGQELLFGYRLYWGARPPSFALPPLAQVVATRTGMGGVVGQKRTHFSWRFVVDFAGGDLNLLGKDSLPQAIVSASHGDVELVSARPLDAIHGYRAMFDVRPGATNEPINLRLYLALEKRALSETWLYQWTPPANQAF